MANETLSAKQASNILEQVRTALNDCQKYIGNSITDFVQVLVQNWEDKNAVEFGEQIKKVLSEIVETIKKNKTVYSTTLGEIADAYIKAGGMKGLVMDLPTDIRLSDEAMLRAGVALSKIKEFFPDGDNFGFKDVDKSTEAITEAFTELKNDLNSASVTTIESIKKINAFGNIKILFNLAQSAGEIVTIIKTSIEKLQKSLNEKLDATKQQYKSTGSSAETAAKISAN